MVKDPGSKRFRRGHLTRRPKSSNRSRLLLEPFSPVASVAVSSLPIVSMEFWGVEVKSGSPLRVDAEEEMIVHISLAALGEKKNGGNEPVRLYMKVGDQKLVIGTLSHDKCPQLCTEIVLERSFELSHSWKDGSVFFSGYRVDAHESDSYPYRCLTFDNLLMNMLLGLALLSDDDEPAEPAVTKSGVKQVNFQLPNDDAKAEEDDEEDDSDDDEDDDDSEDEEEEKKVTAEVEEDDDDEDSSDDEEDDSSDEETPEKKVEEAKKRPAEATTSKTASNKKAKFVTPQKSESKKPHVHVATPHPSKGGKSSGSNGESSKQQQQQTPKSANAFGCSSCNRTFTSEMGLQSHTKAKHSGVA
ncbi:BnaCnng02600D [Brassica napus]|uniref:BnaCnng02600D protein n=1 Tax=Brassica napus TaxID=3708 RepID=A0A078FBI2_BRANA|nr:BnaCnng02600D [Brassica napus]